MTTSDVCPTEDAIHAFLDHVVDPMLPTKTSMRNTPSLAEQQSVAKQVHAVVLLYNYYHRKQHQQLKFEGFEPFCKLAVIQKPTLLSHMKLMRRSDNTESDDVENQLSLTERTIMDACDISKSLEVLKDVPSLEGWPISKVAVFLIDSRKENCFLQFGSITKGVWSIIEKDVNASSCISEGKEEKDINRKIKVTKETLRDELSDDEVCFQQHAFSAVKEATGFNQSDLVIMGSDVVYSLSKEKTAARFYMMQCTQPSTHDVINVPIKDAMDSLQGPLVMRSSGQWTVTPVVEYFHLLPYASIVSDLLSREMPYNDLQDGKLALRNINKSSSSKRREKPYKPEVHDYPDRSHLNSGKVDCLGRGTNTSIKPTELKGRNRCSMNDLLVNPDGPFILDMDTCSVSCPQSENKCNNITSNVQSDDHDEMINTGLKTELNGISVETKVEVADTVKTPCVTESKSDNLGNVKAASNTSLKSELNGKGVETKVEVADTVKTPCVAESKSDNLGCLKATCSTSLKSELNGKGVETKVEVSDTVKTPYVTESKSDNLGNLKATCNAVSPDQDDIQIDDHALGSYRSNTQDQDKLLNVKASMEDVSQTTLQVSLSNSDKLVEVAEAVKKPCLTESKSDSAGNLKVTCNAVSPDEDDIQVDDHALDFYPSNTQDPDKLLNTIAAKENKLSQTALRVLFSKRDKLTLQQRNIEDEIALCDKKIQTILNGGEDDLAVKIESVVEGCNDICPRRVTKKRIYQHLENERSPDPIKMKRLSDAVLSKLNVCQELDGICYGNNWILPTYRVLPSDGGFQASITVKGMDFECSSFGDQCSNPREARESAAIQMLAKLRSMASKSQ